MNLHAITAPYVAAINPMMGATWYQSKDYETNSDGRQAPNYITYAGVFVQCQAFTFRDLRQLDGINLAGSAQAIYINGDIQGVNRPEARGGDIFQLADGTIWLVVHVLENWNRTSGWTKCAVVRQNDWSPPET